MANYYEILGIDQSAGPQDIKAAFRRLAMLYHPDKNSADAERFAVILKAYETLSDPSLRRTYDYRIAYNLAHTDLTSKKTSTKDWRFDEKEMKRRRYYDEHIKKYAKTTAAGEPLKPKNSYNEFKYILFATPLAALLFLLIARLASPDAQISEANTNRAGIARAATNSIAKSPENGDSPYNYHFGQGRFENTESRTLKIKNLTGMDVIVCLFTKNAFVRSFFVKRDFSAEVSQLPGDPLHIRYSSGTGFDKNIVLAETQLSGAFATQQNFFRSIAATTISPESELTLLPGLNEGFEQTGEKDFFKN